MDTFRWIGVVVSMILALGMARLLISAVGLFRARSRAVMDWVPMVWAGAVLIQQIAFWWSLDQAAARPPTWTLPTFLMLVALGLALFLAATLILPANELKEGESLRGHFDRDGRWALLALIGFNLVVVVADWVIWREGPLSDSARLNVTLALIPLAGLFGSRRVQAAAGLAYVLIAVFGMIELSPSSY